MEIVHGWLRRRGMVRARKGRVIAGICASIARSLDVNPWLIRLAAVLSIVIPGPQVLAYVLLWILLPEEEPTT